LKHSEVSQTDSAAQIGSIFACSAICVVLTVNSHKWTKWCVGTRHAVDWTEFSQCTYPDRVLHEL